MLISEIEFRKESTQAWVSVFERDPSDEDGLRFIVRGPNGVEYKEFLYADIPGNSWNQNRLNIFVGRANEQLVHRIPLADLPADDPDKTTDPDDYPRAYWDGGDLCSLSTVIANARYSAETGLDFDINRAV